MWGVEFASDEPFVYSIFGVQYEGSSIPEAKRQLIETLDKLINASATYTDNIIQDGQEALTGWKTRTWLSYWKTTQEYDDWWQSPDTVTFWTSLPADAGVYRETLRASPRRAQLGTNKDTKAGLAHLGSLVPNLDKSLYWGCYRDRYKDACPSNRMNSPLEVCPQPSEAATQGGSQMRLGRTTMTTFPENLCFVVEGQDHSAISAEEKQHWFDNFDKSVTSWMQDLVHAGPAAGILDARICYAADSGLYRNDVSFPALNYNRKIQMFWFLDHKHMEKIGRVNKGHVALRSSFLESYSPTGPMGPSGQLMLWVETSVLKASEMEAEYVGVLEGTGFLAYDHHPEFQSTKQS